uniref:Uncharacterized protein n=2 Tax=Oryza sativa subsp. japonica TaxID=39947 RepID=Q75J28_ORYSJ|nr:hypothetical protein [Oryza sativa Japonica Group]AAS07267.1 hypothetical protein [Oryza sativa Japonica Group]ABF97786.1 hypothetical protein LOC_Os03g43560 [Oryza sativa Japonica Group]
MDSPTTNYSTTSAVGRSNLSKYIRHISTKENSIRHYRRLHVSMVLHQDRLRRVRQVLTRLRRRLYAYLITRERLVDLDKEYGMKRWCTRRDKIS